MHMYDDEIEREAVQPGSDDLSSLERREDDPPREQENEDGRKNDQREVNVVITGGDLWTKPENKEEPERFSPRQELLSLIREEIAAVRDEQEKRALQVAKEEILIALDEAKGRRR